MDKLLLTQAPDRIETNLSSAEILLVVVVYVMELGAYLALFGFGGNAALCGNGNVPDGCGWGRVGQLVGRCSVVRRKPLLVDVVVGEAVGLVVTATEMERHVRSAGNWSGKSGKGTAEQSVRGSLSWG
jgi:hypothetical protein